VAVTRLSPSIKPQASLTDFGCYSDPTR
jgi:hypothetical protein